MRHRASTSVQQALGVAAVGDGYVLRDDGVAVALLELAPPDLAASDEASVAALLQSLTAALAACPDRLMLLSYAVPHDLRPLLRALDAARDAARDWTSYLVLHALSDIVAHALPALGDAPSVRWVLAVPSEAPELPPRGDWGELAPSHLVPPPRPLAGDAVEAVRSRARRLASSLALGLREAPRELSRAEVLGLLRLALDPVDVIAHPERGS